MVANAPKETDTENAEDDEIQDKEVQEIDMVKIISEKFKEAQVSSALKA